MLTQETRFMHGCWINRMCVAGVSVLQPCSGDLRKLLCHPTRHNMLPRLTDSDVVCRMAPIETLLLSTVHQRSHVGPNFSSHVYFKTSLKARMCKRIPLLGTTVPLTLNSTWPLRRWGDSSVPQFSGRADPTQTSLGVTRRCLYALMLYWQRLGKYRRVVVTFLFSYSLSRTHFWLQNKGGLRKQFLPGSGAILGTMWAHIHWKDSDMTVAREHHKTRQSNST